MKFSCEKALLLSAVVTAARAVSPKSTIPALEGVLVEADRSGVSITGYNLETGIKTKVEANVEKSGAAVLNTRLFGDIIRKLPDDMVSIACDEQGMVTIRCGLSEFNIPSTPAADFPEMPAIEKQRSFTVEQETLRTMIGRTIFAVSSNENKPVHTGSLFEVTEEALTVVSVDGYRLAMCTEPITKREQAEDFSFVVPGSALKEVERISLEGGNPAEITLGMRHILFEIGGTLLISRLLEGEFINYRNAIPRDQKVRVKGKVKAMCESVERVSIVISEKIKNPVRCVFDDGLLRLSCTAAIGRAYDECVIDGNGGQLELGFNNRFLLDALRAVPDDEVFLELSSSVSPLIILPPDSEKYLFMILPVRLRANEG